ncbi:hypothetical protein ACGFNU_46245 [Spirillospora sp. NPDC048911]|uniref:hypothetical protein n=1 Tax=Spirillospora sp. NPDC048911 TaxID=3364527 RepID=UPI00371CB409
MDIFTSPTVRIEQLSSRLDYQISDGGTPLGRATQVAGPKPRKGPLSLFGSGLQGARVVVQVSGLDGAPLFYVDRQDAAPVAIVAPDTTLIGRLVEARPQAAPGAGFRAAVHAVLAQAGPAQTHHLMDAHDRPLATVNWDMRVEGASEHRRWVAVGGAFSAPNGQRIARVDIREAAFKDQYTLHLHHRLPEPLRTLVIATPLAFDLIRT